MTTLKANINDNPKMLTFIHQVTERLHNKGYLNESCVDDIVNFGFDNRGAFLIQCQCNDDQVIITTPISSTGYLLFHETKIRRTNKPELELMDLLVNRLERTEETLSKLKVSIRCFVADTIIATYPR